MAINSGVASSPVKAPVEGFEDRNMEFAFVFMVSHFSSEKETAWIMDSGATSSATFLREKCFNISPCAISVCAAGGSFIVKEKGSVSFTMIDKKGRFCNIRLDNVLISSNFSYQLWALLNYQPGRFCNRF
jgi:hypothetical protein